MARDKNCRRTDIFFKRWGPCPRGCKKGQRWDCRYIILNFYFIFCLSSSVEKKTGIFQVAFSRENTRNLIVESIESKWQWSLRTDCSDIDRQSWQWCMRSDNGALFTMCINIQAIGLLVLLHITERQWFHCSPGIDGE